MDGSECPLFTDFQSGTCQMISLNPEPMESSFAEPVELGVDFKNDTIVASVKSEEWSHVITGRKPLQLFRLFLEFQNEGSEVCSMKVVIIQTNLTL